MIEKVMLHLSFDHHELQNAMLLLMMPSFMWCQHWYHMTKKVMLHPYFNHFDLTNKMEPLTLPSVSCDAHTFTNGITWPKELCHMSFQLSSPDEQNGVIDDAVSIMWQQCWHHWYHMTEKFMFHLILNIVTLWYNGTIDNAIGITKICPEIV